MTNASLGVTRMSNRERIRDGPAGRRCALALVVLLAWGCGHAIGPGLEFEPGPRFDFRRPPECAGAAAGDESVAPHEVVVRYLGAGGLFVGWRGHGLLTSPFFSNPGLLRVGLRRMRSDEDAVDGGLRGVPVGSVGAILAGHSHYDHLGDLPAVARLASGAALYVNRSGANALAGHDPALAPRLRPLDGFAGEWIQLRDARGAALPFRVMPVRSSHAPHVFSLTLWGGETLPGEKGWDRRRYGALKAGQPFAFVLDLLEDGAQDARVRFRIYVQDAASQAPLGVPPERAAGDPPYDLAVLCMASTQWVNGHPEELLGAIAPRHVLVTHYENFMRPWGPRRGFVPLLTRAVANGFLRRAAVALEAGGVPPAPPSSRPCGPSSPRWTMPLTGEWLVFRADTR